jgi:adenylate cyclase
MSDEAAVSPTDRRPGRLRKLVRQLGWGQLLISAAALAVLLGVARETWHIPLLIDAEHALFDARIVVTAPLVRQDPRILLVPYTDETLIATGKRSPLDRATLARALARLDTMGAKAIGIDILIDQPQAEDAQLIAAFRTMRTPTYLAYASAAAASDKILYRQQQFLEQFQRAIAGPNVHPATIIVQTDSDNVMRRWAERPAGTPPRIVNAMAASAPGFEHFAGTLAYRRPALKDEPIFSTVPIDTFADDQIFAIPGTADVIALQVRGRYVLIGGNIEDIDIFQTPLSRATVVGESRSTWGMNLFAAQLAQLLDGRLPRPLPEWQLWLVGIAAVAGGGLTAALNRRPLISVGAIGLQIALLAGAPFVLALTGNETYGMPAFGWLLGWAGGYVVVSAGARALSSEQRRFAQGALGKYLPRDIAQRIIQDPDSLRLSGEKRAIFVIFSDLEGFTSLSQAVDPEMIASLLNRYLDLLSNVVLEHGGTIDKFVGDAVVAFWGAPIARDDDGARCIAAALAMHAAGERFRQEAPAGVPPIGRTRVGVHWGEAIVGNFGGEGRIQYTALGDTMNTAARLEDANKKIGTSILVSGPARTRCGFGKFRALGNVVLRGRASAIDIYEPVPDSADADVAAFDAVAHPAIGGDAAARAELASLSAKQPGDQALAKLVYRLENQKGTDHYVLD